MENLNFRAILLIFILNASRAGAALVASEYRPLLFPEFTSGCRALISKPSSEFARFQFPKIHRGFKVFANVNLKTQPIAGSDDRLIVPTANASILNRYAAYLRHYGIDTRLSNSVAIAGFCAGEMAIAINPDRLVNMDFTKEIELRVLLRHETDHASHEKAWREGIGPKFGGAIGTKVNTRLSPSAPERYKTGMSWDELINKADDIFYFASYAALAIRMRDVKTFIELRADALGLIETLRELATSVLEVLRRPDLLVGTHLDRRYDSSSVLTAPWFLALYKQDDLEAIVSLPAPAELKSKMMADANDEHIHEAYAETEVALTRLCEKILDRLDVIKTALKSLSSLTENAETTRPALNAARDLQTVVRKFTEN